MKDKRLASVLGLFIGDALGAPVEFKAAGSFEPVTGYRGHGTHNLEPGQWTDDGAMALATMRSVALTGKWSLPDMVDNWIQWMHHGDHSSNGRCFDIGMATSQALRHYSYYGFLDGNYGKRESAGNGVLMRMAPAAAFWSGTNPVSGTLYQIDKFTQVTHGSPVALYCSRYLYGLLDSLYHGVRHNPAIGNGVWAAWRTWAGKLEEAKGAKLQDLRVSTGHCLDSLCMGVWALEQSRYSHPASILLDVINRGGDSDTNGAIAGQILGAAYGMDWIPQEWLDGLTMKDDIVTAYEGMMSVRSDYMESIDDGTAK